MTHSTTGVVTCFLRNRGEVLLCHRSEATSSCSSRWGAVASLADTSHADGGHTEGDPDALAREVIEQETGLLDAVTVVRAGEPFITTDYCTTTDNGTTDNGTTDNGTATTDDRNTRWRVHPYLFECDHRGVEPNDEIDEYEWITPTEIFGRETVPDLWSAYQHVAPTLETVREDTQHGSATISIRALEVLRDRAGALAERDGGHDVRRDWDELATLARDLREVRPSMTAIENRVNRVMYVANGTQTPRAIERAAREGIERSFVADTDAAANAATEIAKTGDADAAGHRVLTLSRSGTVLTTLRQANLAEVIVAESRPAREGVAVAEALAEDTDVTLAVDAALAHLLAQRAVDAVVVGADTVLPDGTVVNKVGTRGAALAAAHEGVPVLVVAASDKIAAEKHPWIEAGAPEDVYDGDATLTVANPVFDATPPGLVAAIVTEDGVFDFAGVKAVATTHHEWSGWSET